MRRGSASNSDAPPRQVTPTGRAACCQHPERPRFELLLASGVSIRAIARKYKLDPYCVTRHWRDHVSEERRAALIVGPVERAALAARVCEESESVIDHLKAARAGLWALFDSAVTGGDGAIGAMVAGRLHENLRSMARLTGQLATSPLISNTTNIAIMNSPLMADLQTMLIRALQPFPDARAAVLAGLEDLSRRAQLVPAGATSASALPKGETVDVV